MRAVPDEIAPFVPEDWSSLGTDGFGLSDTRDRITTPLPRRRTVHRAAGALERLAHLKQVDSASSAGRNPAIRPR